MRRIDENTNPLKLAWPIFIEILLFMIMGNVDTLMLSRYSEVAVASVGNANQILNTLLIFFNITSAATGIMVTQYSGANQRGRLNEVYHLAYAMNLALALVIGLGFAMAKGSFLRAINLPAELYPDTLAYLNISLNFLFIPALFVVSSTILKSHGQTKLSMYLAIGMNILNVIGNYIFLFGPFGLPILGVQGVAISTVISRLLALIFMLFILVKHYGVAFKTTYLLRVNKALVKQFVKLGLPSAGEPMSWQFSQMVIFSFVNLLGSTVVTARVFVQIIVWFTYLASLALAQANQIVVGHLIGANKEEAAYHLTRQTLKRAIIITLMVSSIFAIFRYPLMGLFTSNPEIIRIGAMVIIVDVFVEFGRAFNLVVISAIKAAGDVVFPTVVGIFSMWLISTVGAYMLGIHLGFGLVGIWIAMAADEILRGLIMYRRLQKGHWRGKAIVNE